MAEPLFNSDLLGEIYTNPDGLRAVVGDVSYAELKNSGGAERIINSYHIASEQGLDANIVIQNYESIAKKYGYSGDHMRDFSSIQGHYNRQRIINEQRSAIEEKRNNPDSHFEQIQGVRKELVEKTEGIPVIGSAIKFASGLEDAAEEASYKFAKGVGSVVKTGVRAVAATSLGSSSGFLGLPMTGAPVTQKERQRRMEVAEVSSGSINENLAEFKKIIAADDEFANTFYGKVAGAIGGSLPATAGFMFSKGLGVTLVGTQNFDDAFETYMENVEEADPTKAAEFAMIVATATAPASVIDPSARFGGVFRNLKNTTQRQILNQFLLSIPSEVIQEEYELIATNFLTKAMDVKDVGLFDGFAETAQISIATSLIMGGGMSTIATLAKTPGGTPSTPEHWNNINKRFREEILEKIPENDKLKLAVEKALDGDTGAQEFLSDLTFEYERQQTRIDPAQEIEEVLLLTEGIKPVNLPEPKTELEETPVPFRPGDTRDVPLEVKLAEKEARKIAKEQRELQEELDEINAEIDKTFDALEFEGEAANISQEFEQAPFEEEKLSEVQDRRVSKLLGHISGQGKKLTAKQLAVLKAEIRGDKKVETAIKRGAKKLQQEKIRSQEKLAKQAEKFANKEAILKEQIELEGEKRVAAVNTVKLKMKEAVKKTRDRLNERISKLKEELSEVKRENREKLIDQRVSTAEAYDQLVNMVNSLPKEFRSKFPLSKFKQLAKKTGIDAKLEFLDEMDIIIDNIFEDNTKKVLLKEINKEVEFIQKAESRALEGRSKEFKYGPETLRHLELAGFGSGQARADAQKAYESLVERIESASKESPYEMTDADYEIRRNAIVPNIAEGQGLDNTLLQNYLDDLRSIKKDGLTRWQAKEKARKDRLEGETNKIVNKISAKNSARKSGKLSPDDAAYQRGISSMLSGLNKNILDIRSVNAILTGEKGGPLKKLVIDRIADGVSDSIVAHREYVDFVNTAAKDLKVDLFKSGSIPISGVLIGNRQMSLYEAMHVYGHSQNDIGLEHLKNTKFGGEKLEAYIDDIIDALPAEYKQFVDKLIDYNDEVMYPKLNELYMEMNGLPMPKESRYLPIVNLSHGTAFDVAMTDNPAFMRIHMNFMKSRTGSVAGFKSLDLIGSLQFHNSSAEHAVALHSVLRDAKTIFDNKEFQDSVNQADENALQYLKEFIKDVALGEINHPKNSFVKLLRTMRNNVRTYWLATNPGSWMKTQAPLFSAAQEIGAEYMASAMTSHFSKSNWKVAREKSKFMNSRKHTNRIERTELINRQFESAKLGKFGKAASLVKGANKWAQDRAYFVYDPLDLAATSTVWVAKYSEGMNKHGREDKAIREADDVVKRHFPSGRIDELPPIFRDSGLLKEFTIFTADMNRMYNLGYSATQLKTRRIQNGMMFAFYSVFLSSAYLAFTDMGGDEFKELVGTRKSGASGEQFFKDWARYSGSQVVGGVPLVGKMVEGGIAKAVGDGELTRLMASQTPISLYPVAEALKGDYLEAGASAIGLPAGNILAPIIQDYADSMFDGGSGGDDWYSPSSISDYD